MAVGFVGFALAARLARIRFSWTKHGKSGEGGTRRMASAYKVGESVVVRLSDGRLVEAKIRAIVEQTNGYTCSWIICTTRPR